MHNAELYQKSNGMQRRDAIQCLDTYARKIKWRKHDRVVDIGCGDGSVTNIIKTYMPVNSKLLGCDISEKMIDFANDNHSDSRTEFIVLDIEGKLPHGLRDSFDHAFSFYALHWIKNQELGFRNIFQLLTDGGDCLLMFLGHMPIFDVYRRLARNQKWTSWLGDVDRFVSPYHDLQNPERHVAKMLDRVGFSNIEVKCKKVEYIYDSVDILKRAVSSINPFNIPKDLLEEFLDDYVDSVAEVGMVHLTNNNIGEDQKIQFKSELALAGGALSYAQDEIPLDTLSVKIKSLSILDEEPIMYKLKVVFQDQTIIDGEIMSANARAPVVEKTLLCGSMSYDASDYEKMSGFADYPLNVSMVEKTLNPNPGALPTQTPLSSNQSNHSQTSVFHRRNLPEDAYCCNVDILSLFIEDETKMTVEKRMEPLLEPTHANRKSWDVLPTITLELDVYRNPELHKHHEVLMQANVMKITLIGVYNTIIPYDEDFVYTAASKTVTPTDTNVSLVTFYHGLPVPRRFDSMSFYPKWESLRAIEGSFTKSSKKCVGKLSDVQNKKNIPLEFYIEAMPNFNTVMWGTFHRSLFLQSSEAWLVEHLRKYSWPFEVHINGENTGFSFMAFLDLFRLLYPGETTVRIAAPLIWINSTAMMKACNCDILLMQNEKAPNSSTKQSKASGDKTQTQSETTDTNNGTRVTGTDENNAFVIIEVKLARPLKKQEIMPLIQPQEIKDMLKSFELAGVETRKCSGRGQLDKLWQTTTKATNSSIRSLPHHNLTEFCKFNRQLSVTRTRVELATSFWQDAAVYVNNNFNVQEYLLTDEAFEEMLIMAHACLTKSAIETLVGVDKIHSIEPLLLAAIQARQMQDVTHAVDLFVQLVTQMPRDGNRWRQLAVCLLDFDKDWANVCINKAMVLNPRHPLSLLVKGAMVFEENPVLAEPFFLALLAHNPRWTTMWVIAKAYFLEVELFHIADKIQHCIKQTYSEGLVDNKTDARVWSKELGDWWETTPLLPGMSRYLDAADLLLRLRAFTLAEACLARSLMDASPPAAYYHLVALCCRLRGDYKNALCHLRTGIEAFGEISYLRSLEAECYHKLKNMAAAKQSYQKAGSNLSPCSTLLSVGIWEPARIRTMLIDLVRRQPSAYAWMALADDWMLVWLMLLVMTNAFTIQAWPPWRMERTPPSCGGDAAPSDEQVAARTSVRAYAIMALHWDRWAGRAWALLAKLVHPSARRLYCNKMVDVCGYVSSEEKDEFDTESKQSLCYHLGSSLRECRCNPHV